VYDVTGPAIAIVAARGAVWGWSAGPVPRIGATAFLLAAGVAGVQQWFAWLH
jgi:hypothetical protein